jgi:hypothetical protein
MLTVMPNNLAVRVCNTGDVDLTDVETGPRTLAYVVIR